MSDPARWYFGFIVVLGIVCAAALGFSPLRALALVPVPAGPPALILRPTFTVPFVDGLLLVRHGIDFGSTVGVHLTASPCGDRSLGLHSLAPTLCRREVP